MNKPTLPTAPTIAKLVVPLSNLLQSLNTFVPFDLTKIVAIVAPDVEHAIQDQIVGALQRRLSGQQSRTTAKMLAHVITKQVDVVLDNDLPLSLDQKQHAADLLCQNLAHALIQTAERLTNYPPYQRAVIEAKHDGDPTDIEAARLRRDGAAEAVHNALLNVGRIAAGQRARSEDTDAPH